MKDTPFEIVGDSPIEARIVAWVLGEASAFEAAELERLCEDRPELLVFRRRMTALHGLLTDAESAQPDESWKLSPEKRSVLDEICGVENVVRIEAQKELRISRIARRAFLSIAACVTLTFIVIRLTPWKHEAEAIIEIKPRVSGLAPLGNASAESQLLTPQFFGTEFEKIKSSKSLEQVVDNLDLTNRWNVDKDSAIKRLKGSIETKNVKGTDLISIRVRDASERDAQEITQQVVQSYKVYRSEIENRDAEKALYELNKAVRDQEDKVEEARKVLATIVRTKGIVNKSQDSFYEQSSADNTHEDAIKRGLDTQDYVDAKRDFETDQDLLQKLKLKAISQMMTEKLTQESVIVHEMTPPVEPEKKVDFTSRSAGGDLAQVPLRTQLPDELIEGTPKPMNVPNLEAQVNGPAGSSSWGSKGKKLVLPQSPNAKQRDLEIEEQKLAALKGQIDIVGGSSFTRGAESKSERESRQSLPTARGMVVDALEGIEKRLEPLADNGKPQATLPPATASALPAPAAAPPSVAQTTPAAGAVGMMKSGAGVLTKQSGAQESAKQSKLAAASAKRAAEAKPLGLESNGALPDPAVPSGMPQLADVPTDGALKGASGNMDSGQWSGLGGGADGGGALGETGDGDERRGLARPRVVAPAKEQQELMGKIPRIATRDLENRDKSSFGDRQLPPDESATSASPGGFKNLEELSSTASEALVDGRGQAEGEKAMKHRRPTASAQPPVLKSKAKEENQRLPAKPSAVATADQDSEEIALGGANTYTGGTAVTAGTLGPMDTQTALTNGLRSGDQAVNRESVDAVLNNPNRVAWSVKDESQKTSLPESHGVLSDLPRYQGGLKKEFQGSVNYGAPIADSSGPTGEAAAADPFASGGQSSIEQAERFRKVGKYAEARKELEGILAREPDNADAQQKMNYLTDPIRTSPALTYEHAQNVDAVRRDLYTAEGNFNLGKFDDSKKAYEEVLKKDPYNAAARRGLEKVSSAKSDYYRAAYDQTRAELLSQVDAAWELSVPTDGKKKTEAGEVLENEKSKRDFKFTTEYEPPAVDKYWDTSSAVKPGEKDRNGIFEQEIHTGHQPEYLFRGLDLSKEAEPAPALVDLMEEISAAETPYSTFSLNINDASFQLAKAALAKGERPDPASIKTEQFYNAVDYGDPAPTAGEPVSGFVEQSAHPVIPGRNLVRVALRTASTGRSAAQPLRLTLLVDQSGSMVREDRRASMDHALAQLGVLLTKNDLVTVIGFSRTPRLLAENLSGDQAGKLSDLIHQEASEGGTNLEEAMKVGGQKAMEHLLDGAQNRIVLFTDGAANLGDAKPERLAEQVKAFRQNGLAFDIAGIGADGLNDRLLSELARNGNGRYYVVGNEKNDSFARQLAGAFRPAAENVKVQVNFNPQRVGNYKLIGFEKDRLKTEDFRNDAVDAAELAADEAGVAIYQVEPLAEGTGELGEVSVRFRDAASKEMVERTWTISYDSEVSAFDRATPSMQLAGLSLLAAEKLKGGPFANAIDFKQFATPQAMVKQFYGGSPRVGDMLQVIEKLK